MGQKTNPKGFRLVTTQKSLSIWFTNKKNYSSLIQEDFFIRVLINKIFSDFLLISKIKINRISNSINKNEYINIKLYILYPRKKEILKYINKQEFLKIPL
jgi:hypothetical protein